MNYSEHKPHPFLSEYIDAYWTATGDLNKSQAEKILPDGCIDIIYNAGEDCKTENGTVNIQNEKTYLIGTMTRFKETSFSPDTRLMGIRFKPAAFSAFYKTGSLHELADQTIELEKSWSPDFRKTKQCSADYLNQFFLRKLSGTKHNLSAVLTVVADIQNQKGQVNVKNLARRHFTTNRQLERSFRQYLGISPKEFISLVRYQFAFTEIMNNTSHKSLLDIAFDCGYYDHAHLTNEVRRYTGSVPSQF